ncbi:uncharacterized protein [Ptychodera flava]|uniref:uncharacterized protein isoform X1 n=1 Tax=Ptychodera flava TaxID=63121 RepID=UPI00396A0785
MENLDPSTSLASSQTSSQDPEYVPEECDSPDRIGTYFQGVSRSSYTLRLDLTRQLTRRDCEFDGNCKSKASTSDVCSICEPVLTQAAVSFFTIQHWGNVLKKRQSAHQEPVKGSNRQWRNIVEENRWIRGNLFDPAGNYLFCQQCIIAVLDVSRQRLASQRDIKRQEFLNPVVLLTKRHVTNEKLEKYVLIPDNSLQWDEWWASLSSDDEVEVRQFAARHGLEGKVSNNSKNDVKEQFLEFVDANTYPTGRSEYSASSGPLYYFLPVFTRVSIPKVSENNYNTKLMQSVVSVFNQTQQHLGRETVSSRAAESWLSQHRPRHSIQPHKSDYCNTCKEVSKEILTKSTTVQRMRESGDAEDSELERVKLVVESLKKHLAEHKKEASAAQHFYKKSCQHAFDHQKKIEEREETMGTHEEEIQLLEMKTDYIACYSFDYKMVITLPQWHLTPQPAMSYYKMKLCVDEAAVIQHNTGKAYTYIFDERFGPKNSSHTLSILSHHINNLDTSWITKVMVFMDNAPSTNKNTWLVCWIKEMMLKHETLQYLRIGFLQAGHSKSMPDWVFASISSTMKKQDMFTVRDVQDISSPYSEAKILCDTDFNDWRKFLHDKYGNKVVHGIGAYHDIRGERQHGQVVVMAREELDSGTWQDITPEVVFEQAAIQNITPRLISADKLKQLTEMYDRFVPNEHRIDFLPALPENTECDISPAITDQHGSSSAAIGKQHMKSLKKSRRH